ncbi:MAG TPA: hypothetical protein VG273_03535 [Bryobacteraceae bacterium]|jgi:hypothetical protein|nr:hypothetical protein [Bryobacteraceae bacterium]
MHNTARRAMAAASLVTTSMASLLTLAITANAGIINASFEAPVQGAAQYTVAPAAAGAGWTFQGSSGIAANGYGALANSPTQAGSQSALLDSGSTATSISQSVSGLTIGDNIYFSFEGLGAGPNDTVEVTLNGVVAGIYTLTPDSWVEYTTAQMFVTSSSMALSLIRTGSGPAYVDSVRDVQTPAAPELASFYLIAPLGGIFMLWFAFAWRKTLVAGR